MNNFSDESSVKLATLFKNSYMALLIWLLTVGVGTSLANLMFHGRLSAYVGAGIQIYMVSSVVLCLFCAFFSTNKSVVPSPQSSPLVILVAIGANLTALAPAAMSDESLFLTILATMILVSLLAGFFYFAIGYLKIAILMRYFPYPVVGGVLAGMGGLLIDGGLTVLTGLEITRFSWTQLFQIEYLFRWLPIAAVSLGLLWMLRRWRNMLILPLALGLSLGLYFLSQVFGGGPALAQEVAAQPSASLAFSLSAFTQVDWGMILSQAGNITVLIIFSTFNLLTNLSATEAVFQRELNFNRELLVSGGANIISALFGGGMIGFPAVTHSTLAHRSGSDGRVINIMLALGLAFTLALGLPVDKLFPVTVLGGLLLFLGFTFLSDWLMEARVQLPRTDYLTIVVMMIVIVVFGLVWGVLCGIVISIAFFVMQYSQIRVVRQHFTGGKFRSRSVRSALENRLLGEHGESILVFRLQGYIFFGTGFKLYRNIKARITQAEPGQINYILLDFRMAQRVDVSSAMDLLKLEQLSEEHGIHIAYTSASPLIRYVLTRTYHSVQRDLEPNFLPDLDYALEWCEDSILAETHLADMSQVSIERQIDSHVLLHKAEIGLLQRYLRRIEVEEGTVIARQGEHSDSLFLIESGKVDILLRNEHNHIARLHSMGPGSIVGEVGFYLHRPRTATIVATEFTVLNVLDSGTLRRIEAEEPLVVAMLHNFIACVLSERLSSTNHIVEELME